MSGEFNPDDDDPMELPPAPDAPPNAAPASNNSRSGVLPSSASPAGVSSPIAEGADAPQLSGRGRSDTKESDKSTGGGGAAGAALPPVPILPVLNGTAASSTSTSSGSGKPALPPVPAGKAGGPPKIDTKSSHPSADTGSGSVSPANITAGSPPSGSGKLPLPPTPNSANAAANLQRQSSVPSTTPEAGHRRADSKDTAAATKSPGLPSARSDRKSGDPPAGQQLPTAARPSGGATVKTAGATAATPTGPKTAIKVNLQNYSGYITLPLTKIESTFGFAKRVIENAKRKKIALPAGESPSNYIFLTVKTGQHLAESTFSANFDPTAKLIDVVMVDSESAQAKAAKPFEGKYAGSGDETPASPTSGASVPPGSPPQPVVPELSAAEKAKREKELRNQLIKEAMRAEMEANEKEEKARAEQELKDRIKRDKLAAERAAVEAIPDVPIAKDPFAAKVQQIRLKWARDKRLAEWLAKQDGADGAAAGTAAPAAAGAGAGANGADHAAAKSPALSPAASPASPRLDGKTMTPADAKAAASALSLDGKDAPVSKHQRTHTTIAGFMEGRARAIELLKKGVYLMKMTRQNESATSKKPYKRLIFLSPSQDRVIWAESRDDIRGFVMCCDVKQVIPNPDDPKGLIIQSSDDPLELQVIPPDQTRDQYLTIFKNIFGK